MVSALETLGALTDDDKTEQLIKAAQEQIDGAIERLAERKAERDMPDDDENDDDDTDWAEVFAVSQKEEQAGTPSEAKGVRSIFNDVDE
ncbi:MAG: hypothetical protein Q8M19_14955 [Reyranella sp.]|nr:hypothetical protein [Reyranella sp.]